MNKITLAIGLLFSIAGIYLISRGDSYGWLVLGFFGLSSAFAAIPLLPKQWFAGVSPDSIVGRLRGQIQIPDPKLGVLAFDNGGLRHTTPGGNEILIRWDQVDRITTFKLDLLTTDCICLLFEGRFDVSPYQIHEEMVGYDQIFEPLRDAFPSISDSWYFDVMTPAFETKETILFDRSEAANKRTESNG